MYGQVTSGDAKWLTQLEAVRGGSYKVSVEKIKAPVMSLIQQNWYSCL